MNFKCPLDGAPLSFSYSEENDAYICPSCDAIYPTLSKKEKDILKDITSHALLELKKSQTRLEEIKKEEGKIAKIFEFVEKSGLFKKLNKVNLSAEGAKK
jgi:hypothetical protein